MCVKGAWVGILSEAAVCHKCALRPIFINQLSLFRDNKQLFSPARDLSDKLNTEYTLHLFKLHKRGGTQSNGNVFLAIKLVTV